jgi:hypothetical protein
MPPNPRGGGGAEGEGGWGAGGEEWGEGSRRGGLILVNWFDWFSYVLLITNKTTVSTSKQTH